MDKPRELLSPADDTASRAIVNVQTAVTRVKEMVTEGVAKGLNDNEIATALNSAIASECRKIANKELREQTRRALVASAKKWHYELVMTYRVLDGNLVNEAARQPLNIDITNLNKKTPFEKMAEFRKILDDGTSLGIPVIKDYQRSVKIAIKAMSAEPPKIVSRTGRAMPIRLRAEMAVRYAAAVENLQRLIDNGVKFCWISSHPNCSPRCSEWQGKLYSLFSGSVVIDGKEYGERGSIDGINYRPINDALAGNNGDGNGCISGYNCRHRAIEYNRGSKPPQDYSAEEMRREYAVDKQQRNFENRIRQLKTEERQLRTCGMDKEAAAVRKQWQKLTTDYKIYSVENDRAFYPYRCVIDEAEEKGFVSSEKTDITANGQQGVDISVKWSIINNKKYFDGLKELVGKRNAGNALQRAVLGALDHRDGTKGEDLYLIDLRSGVVAVKNTSSDLDLGVEKSEKMDKLLNAKDDRQYIVFHNHPLSSPPSVTDLNSLYYNKKIKFGIIVGHDGTIYKYTAPNKIINDNDLNILLKHYLKLGYSKETAQEKAYEILKSKFTFDLEIIKW